MPSSATGSAGTFGAFSREVRESIEKHARRKNYIPNGNSFVLRSLFSDLGIGSAHAIAEIIYKAIEYLKSPRRVLLVKIASWAYLEWRDCKKP